MKGEKPLDAHAQAYNHYCNREGNESRNRRWKMTQNSTLLTPSGKVQKFKLKEHFEASLDAG